MQQHALDYLTPVSLKYADMRGRGIFTSGNPHKNRARNLTHQMLSAEELKPTCVDVCEREGTLSRTLPMAYPRNTQQSVRPVMTDCLQFSLSYKDQQMQSPTKHCKALMQQ